jgi:hypothetical protein
MAATAGLLQVVQVRVIAMFTEAILPITAVRRVLFRVPEAVRNILYLKEELLEVEEFHQVHIADLLLLLQVILQAQAGLSQEAHIQVEDLHRTHPVRHHTLQDHHQAVGHTVHRVVHPRGEDKINNKVRYIEKRPF